MTLALLLTVKAAILALILAIGMSATFGDVLYLWRRPRLLVRSLLAMYVAVPLAAYLLVVILPLSPGIKAAMLVLAVSAGAPLLPRKLSVLGNTAYVFSIVVTSSLLAIVIVPAWVALLAWHFDVDAAVSPLAVASAIAKAFLLPLAIGLVAHAVAPAPSERLADRILQIAGIILTAAGVVLLAAHWHVLLEVRLPDAAALLLLLVIAASIGHLLGGPPPEDRTTLAIACATRHIGIAVVVATTFRGPRTLVLLAAFVVASALVSISYLRWRRAQKAVGEVTE
jgi:bile acid:Na+ symporter, BASS family